MSENNQEGYRTLGWIINQSESGLFLVVAEEPVQGEITDVYRGGKIGVYDFKRYPGEYSFPKLKEWMDSLADVRTFFIVNFQFALQSGQDISRLNFSRDMLARTEKNLVFFTTPYGDDRLAAEAYDFYSFLKLRIIFHGYTYKTGTPDATSLETGGKRTEVDGPEERNGGRPGKIWNVQQKDAEGEPEAVKERLREAYALVQQGKEACDKANYRESAALLLRALEIYEDILGAGHLETAAVYYELANIYKNLSAYERAEDWCNKALRVHEKVLGAHPDTADDYDILAQIYEKQGKYKEAEELSRKAVRIARELLGEEHPNTTTYLNNLAVIYEEQGQYEKAEPLYQQALRTAEKVLGEKNSNTAAGYNNLALNYLKQERYREAEELLGKSLAIRKEVLEAGHPDIAMNYHNLAAVCEKQGRFAEAEELYRKAIAIYERVFREGNLKTANAYNNLAGLYDGQGKYREAEEFCTKSVSIYERLFGGKHPGALIVYDNLAYLYMKQGAYEKAEAGYRKTLSLCKELYGDAHPETIESYCSLADCCENRGENKEAEELYREALAIAELILGRKHDQTKYIADKLASLRSKADKEEPQNG